jgi:hypothetical protein
VRVGKAWVVVEAAAAQAPSPKTVVAHDRVVRRLFRSSEALLPLRFASTAPDAKTLVALLAPLADPISRAFERVRGSVQFTVKITGPSKRGARVRRSARAGPGTRWLTSRAAMQRVPEIEALTEATRPFVRATRVERHDGSARKAPDGRLGTHRKPVLATVYHLVAREDVTSWKRAVARSLPLLGRNSASVSGPWPAYAFAELE